ncbi:MAG: TerB family tellurite resistance protein [Sandaracinaceae bacterium]|nr:TerB family tellurite resistance protein [Sandaracinaceae bacterium]
MLVAKVLAADGIMTDDERDFLESAMASQGLTDDERTQVRNFDGWDEAEPIVATLSLDDKRELMDGLVQAVLADGKVSPHEMTTIEQLTAVLGLE